jgi:hypothetical protein
MPGVGYNGAAKLLSVKPKSSFAKLIVFRFSNFINTVRDFILKLKKKFTSGRLLINTLSWGKNLPITGE